MMQASRRNTFLWLIFVLLVPLRAAAATSPGAKRPITEAEFLRLVKADQTITNRIVPATAIIKALLWTQEASKAHEPLPTGIALENCIVEGDLSFYEGLVWSETPTKHTNTIKTLLNETSVDTLSQELSQRYKNAGIEEVIVIPVGLQFSSTQFKSDSDFAFLDTIFDGDLAFNDVDFGTTYVRFDHSAFLNAHFDSSKFESGLSFAGATFLWMADFSGSDFKSAVAFDNVDFQGDVIFDSVFGSDLRFEKGVSFRGASFKYYLEFSYVTFGEGPNFGGANIANDVLFSRCKFAGDAFFTDLNEHNTTEHVGNLRFSESTFSERAYFTNSRLNVLSFFPDAAERQSANKLSRSVSGAESPVIMSKRSVFTGLYCKSADFREAEFREYADFSEAQFTQSIDFSNATFEGGVSFYNTSFPNIGADRSAQQPKNIGLVLSGAQFPKGMVLDWKQIDRSLNFKEPETLKRIEDSFKLSGDLEGQNEAMYRRKRLEGDRAGRWQHLINRFDFIVWGYGVRPLRLLGWMLVVFLLFTSVYWTQTKELAHHRNKLKDAWKRLELATAFSLRTSWTLGFGYNNARTPTFKIITLVHSIGFKILLLCLLQTFANTSPLLNQLVGKLIHV
jgi:uncharacterized protein YjbI with pentapeptide repeats